MGISGRQFYLPVLSGRGRDVSIVRLSGTKIKKRVQKAVGPSHIVFAWFLFFCPSVALLVFRRVKEGLMGVSVALWRVVCMDCQCVGRLSFRSSESPSHMTPAWFQSYGKAVGQCRGGR